MNEHHLTTPRTARLFTRGNTHNPAEVWYVVHGYGQLAKHFLHRFRTLDDGTRLLVAPEALNRYYTDHKNGRVGATWMTREDRLHEIDDYVRFLDAVRAHTEADLPAAPHRVVLGFSQGVSTVCRWAARGDAAPDHLVLWTGSLPPELTAADLPPVPITYVYGTQDRLVTPDRADAVRAFFQAHPAPVRFVPFDGGHAIHEATLQQLTQPVAP